MLILGGDQARELAAVRALERIPSVRLVILSSGATSEEEMHEVVAALDRHVKVLVDRAAVDTVSNFTTVAASLATARVDSVVVATDKSHAQRASALGRIILGAYGIGVRSLVVSCSQSEPAESCIRLLRDVTRAFVWVATGFDGSSLARLVHPGRVADVRAWREQRAHEPLAHRIVNALHNPCQPTQT